MELKSDLPDLSIPTNKIKSPMTVVNHRLTTPIMPKLQHLELED